MCGCMQRGRSGRPVCTHGVVDLRRATPPPKESTTTRTGGPADAEACGVVGRRAGLEGRGVAGTCIVSGSSARGDIQPTPSHRSMHPPAPAGGWGVVYDDDAMRCAMYQAGRHRNKRIHVLPPTRRGLPVWGLVDERHPPAPPQSRCSSGPANPYPTLAGRGAGGPNPEGSTGAHAAGAGSACAGGNYSPATPTKPQQNRERAHSEGSSVVPRQPEPRPRQ